MVQLRRLLAVSAALAAASAANPAAADPVADFYRAKQITIQVGFGVGGGYDATARIVARHFGRHVPGNPTVVVQNVPGAGSMNLANQIYNTARKDGTVLGLFSASVSLEPLFGNAKAKFDPRKFAWVGSFSSESLACGVWSKARPDIRSLQDLIASRTTVIFGSTSPAAPTSQHPMFLKNMFGAPVKVITGYKGTKEVNLAMQRGEVHATCGMFETGVKGPYAQDVKAGNLVLFVQFGRKPVPVFGKATPMYDLLKSDADRQVADLIFRQTELARPVAAPPGTPKERVDALRKALLATMKDPALVADGKKINTEFNPVSGEETVRLFETFFAMPPDLVTKARNFTKTDGS